MKPWTRVVLLSLALLGQPALSLVAEAGYSSGRSSVSRSSSAGRSAPSRSSGSSSSSSSRSYSSGRSSSNSGSSSHSSGGNSGTSGYSSGKGTSYSSGKGTSYSSGKQGSYASPSSGSFGAAAAAARREESQRAGSGSPAYSSSGSYSNSYSSPRPGFGPSAYRGPDPRDRQIADLRARLDASSYANRHLRQQQFYGAYYSRPMVSYAYHDGYSPWFWMWLLDRHTHQQAAWVYHHRDTMDPSRYDALVKQNAELSQRVAELERQNTPRDPTYVPSELPSADLMYSDTYAAAATQPARPQSVMPPAAARPYSPPVAWNPPPRVHSSAGGLFRGLLFVILMASGIGALVWWMGRRHSSYEDGVWPPRRGGGATIPPRWASQSSADIATDNPLNLQIGQRFTLDLPEDALPLDVRNLSFRVEQILHYTTQVGSGSFHYVAYWAIARPQGGERVVMQLRVERLAAGGLAILALRLQEQFAFDQGFYDIVATDGTGVFQVTDDNTGQVTAEYYRPEGVLSSYTASVLPMSDPGQAGATRRLQFWDYSRQMDTTGGPMCEYLIVEMEDSGWFRIFAGPQVDRSLIRV